MRSASDPSITRFQSFNESRSNLQIGERFGPISGDFSFSPKRFKCSKLPKYSEKRFSASSLFDFVLGCFSSGWSEISSGSTGLDGPQFTAESGSAGAALFSTSRTYK